MGLRPTAANLLPMAAGRPFAAPPTRKRPRPTRKLGESAVDCTKMLRDALDRGITDTKVNKALRANPDRISTVGFERFADASSSRFVGQIRQFPPS